jgi:hypothetical protein
MIWLVPFVFTWKNNPFYCAARPVLLTIMKKVVYILFVVLVLTGCGGNEKLSGRVTFPDGEPLSAGTIYFVNDSCTARAHIRPNGTYDVGSLAQADGLPAGTYKVYIGGAFEVKNGKEILLIAPEFALAAKTPLSITVPGERVYNITVERPQPATGAKAGRR